MMPDYSLKNGDILAFGSCSAVSGVIGIGQCTIPYLFPNHVGIFIDNHSLGPVIVESLMSFNRPCLVQKKVTSGVQVHSLRLRVLTHPGRVWVYPLSKELTSAQYDELLRFLWSYIGTQYDLIGAFRSRQYSFLESWLSRKEDLNRVFCSEFCAAALAKIDVIRTVETNRYNPRRFLRELIEQGAVTRESVHRIK